MDMVSWVQEEKLQEKGSEWIAFRAFSTVDGKFWIFRD